MWCQRYARNIHMRLHKFLGLVNEIKFSNPPFASFLALKHILNSFKKTSSGERGEAEGEWLSWMRKVFDFKSKLNLEQTHTPWSITAPAFGTEAKFKEEAEGLAKRARVRRAEEMGTGMGLILNETKMIMFFCLLLLCCWWVASKEHNNHGIK